MLSAESAIKELEKLKTEGANLLMPDIVLEGLSDWHKVVIERIKLDPEPHPKGMDCYKDSQSNLLRLTGFALEKLAVSANVQWNLPFCGRADGRADKVYFSYRSVGGIRKPDGSIVWMANTYDLDLDAERDELTKIHTASGKKYKKSGKELEEHVNRCVERDYGFKRKHGLKLCESGSRNRVIRKILNVKSGYSADEMGKPFCTIRVIFQPDMNDPEVKRQLLAAAIQATTGIYGNVAQYALPSPMPMGGNGGEIIDLKPNEPEPEFSNHTDPDLPAANGDPEFDDLDPIGQGNFLSTLAMRKGFPTTVISREDFGAGVKGILRPFHEMSPDGRRKWLEYLTNLDPVVVMASDTDDDIPF